MQGGAPSRSTARLAHSIESGIHFVALGFHATLPVHIVGGCGTLLEEKTSSIVRGIEAVVIIWTDIVIAIRSGE
jgi:hypothetical protein